VIFVVSEGKVVEKGDHSSLVRKRSVYWEMVSENFFEFCPSFWKRIGSLTRFKVASAGFR